jgi:excisionase family DNA binding protein
METLLTQREAASVLRLSTRSLERMRCSGLSNLKFVKVGRAVRYRVADLEAFIASRTVSSTSMVRR